MTNVHLFTTDASGLEIKRLLPVTDCITAVIYPENRAKSDKVRHLIESTRADQIPTAMHPRTGLNERRIPVAQIGISWLYSQIISPVDLARYPLGILNMHGGAIPEYRGASALHWTIVNGEDKLGITWHEIDDEVDAGAICAESSIPIPHDADAAEMREAMIRGGLRSFPEAWDQFRNRTRPPRFPDLSKGRVWPQRRSSDSLIEPGWPARRVKDMVRACCPPWPAATIQTENGLVEIRSVSDRPKPGAIDYQTLDGVALYFEPIKRV